MSLIDNNCRQILNDSAWIEFFDHHTQELVIKQTLCGLKQKLEMNRFELLCTQIGQRGS